MGVTKFTGLMERNDRKTERVTFTGETKKKKVKRTEERLSQRKLI